MRTFLVTILLVLVLSFVSSIILQSQSERIDLIVTMIGTFVGFFLSQTGLIIYERNKQKEEFISMLISARSELLMNKGTVIWIDHLLHKGITQKELHTLGFAGVDEISVAAIENIVRSSLVHKFTSKEFTSSKLLTIYQTMLVLKREIPTDEVNGKDKTKYNGIHFGRVIASFDTLTHWLDIEASRICGKKKWLQMTDFMLDPAQLLEQFKEGS